MVDSVNSLVLAVIEVLCSMLVDDLTSIAVEKTTLLVGLGDLGTLVIADVVVILDGNDDTTTVDDVKGIVAY